MTEKQLLEAVRRLARLYGWLCYHPHRSERSEPGYPDVTVCKNGVVRLIELKAERGRVSAAQKAWLGELGPSFARVVRPGDLQWLADFLSGREAW